MSKHTPGPWTAEKTVTRDGDVHWSVRTVGDAPPSAYGRGPRYIAWLTGTLRHDLPSGLNGGPRWRWCEACQRGHYDHREVRVDVRDDPDTEADVRLIAAAPEFLEALKSLVAVYNAMRLPKGMVVHDSDPSLNGEWTAALDAIAQAEGRS